MGWVVDRQPLSETVMVESGAGTSTPPVSDAGTFGFCWFTSRSPAFAYLISHAFVQGVK